MQNKLSTGFTIIELVVVIAIIGILAAVVYGSFGGARTEARNKSFMSDMKQVQLALEVYRAQNDGYPASIDNLVTGNFLPEAPVAGDSANNSCSLSYSPSGSFTNSAGATVYSSYKYTGIRCYSGTVEAGSEFARCPSSCPATGNCNPAGGVAFTESLAVYSLGSQCN